MNKTKVITINNQEILFGIDEACTEKEHNPLIKQWIIDNIVPNLIKNINRKYSSYKIKHICERELGFYVSNYDIKYHMAELGIEGENITGCINYYYPISQKWFNSKSR